MRRLGVVLVVLSAWMHPMAASASCAGPRLTTEGPIELGSTFVVRGDDFGTACNDTGDAGPALGPPDAGVRLSIERSGSKAVLATVDVACDYSFEVRVATPPDLAPGAATLLAEGRGSGSELDIEIGSGEAGDVATPPTFLHGHAADDAETRCGAIRSTWFRWVLWIIGLAGAAWAARRIWYRRRRSAEREGGRVVARDRPPAIRPRT
jgi:hypothetical protein